MRFFCPIFLPDCFIRFFFDLFKCLISFVRSFLMSDFFVWFFVRSIWMSDFFVQCFLSNFLSVLFECLIFSPIFLSNFVRYILMSEFFFWFFVRYIWMSDLFVRSIVRLFRFFLIYLNVRYYLSDIFVHLCCTCKVAILLIRPIVFVFSPSSLRSPLLSSTQFYILFEQTINIIESFAFSPG